MLSAKKQQLEEIIGANNFSNIESLTSDEDILPSLVMTLNQKNNKKHSLSFVESECFFMGIYFSAVLFPAGSSSEKAPKLHPSRTHCCC